MRIPIYKKDLPKNFNKVAKYLGRKWPIGKLNLEKAKNTLAILLGYNSYYEITKALYLENATSTFSMKRIKSSILIKAYHCYGIHPFFMEDLINRIPLIDLQFYYLTDEYKNKQISKNNYVNNGCNPWEDEFDSFYLNDNSLENIIDFKKTNIIPKYQYAITEQKIYCFSEFQYVINKLGTIKDLVTDLELKISEKEFIEKYILPIAMIPVNEYFSNCLKNNTIGTMPFLTKICRVRKNGIELGYVIKHCGVNAFYPILIKDKKSLIKILIELLMGRTIEESCSSSLLQNNIEISEQLGEAPTFSNFLGFYNEVCLKETIRLSNGQIMLREQNNYYKGLTLFKNLKVCIDYENKNFDNKVISKSNYIEHKKIQNIIETNSLNSFKLIENEYQKLLNLFFTDKKPEPYIYFKKMEHYEQDFIDDITEIAKSVLIFHPEFKLMIDQIDLGLMFSEYQEKYYNIRGYMPCYERDESFIFYAITYSSVLCKNNLSSKCEYSLVLILSKFIKSLNFQVSLEKIRKKANNIAEYFHVYEKNTNIITNMEIWAKFSSKKDNSFLTHGRLLDI